MNAEDVPINCMSWQKARDFCQAQGGDLPSEAQFELVASAFSGRLYVWGEDDPACADAVLGRAGWGLLGAFLAPCKPDTPPGGALPVGSDVMPARRDLLELPTGTVYDLVGNMCELSRDMWNRQDEPCWSQPGVYTDPVCDKTSPADGSKHVYRGGCWDIIARLATSASREGIPDTATSGLIGLGFRCARSAVGSLIGAGPVRVRALASNQGEPYAPAHSRGPGWPSSRTGGAPCRSAARGGGPERAWQHPPKNASGGSWGRSGTWSAATSRCACPSMGTGGTGGTARPACSTRSGRRSTPWSASTRR